MAQEERASIEYEHQFITHEWHVLIQIPSAAINCEFLAVFMVSAIG